MNYHRGTIEQFDLWHASAKQSEGIIGEGRIGSRGGKMAPGKQRTTAYSSALLHPRLENDYIWLYGRYLDDNLTVLTEREAKTEGWFSDEEV